MMRKIAIGTLLATLCLLGAGVASAATIGFVPGADVTAGLGDNVTVDIVISDLGGEIVSAYDLDVLYDATMLTPTSVDFTDELGNVVAGEALVDWDVPTPGVLDLASLSLLWDPALVALQDGDTVTLATIGFQGIAAGTSQLSLVFDEFNDVKGLRATPLELEVGGEPAIPEPGAALVFAAGAAVVAGALRRRRA
jgi:hypothetical protein